MAGDKIKAWNPRVLLTVSGRVTAMFPARNRPGCVLELSNGKDTGLYYVPLSLHDCRREFPENSLVKFRVWEDAKPGESGIIDTAGNETRLWEITGGGACL